MHTAVKFKTAALAALLALAGPSLAQTLPTVPPEVLPQVKVDLSSEAAGCGLYYTLAANIIERDFPDKDTTQMREAAKASTAMAAMPVSKEVANANLQMANDDMKRLLSRADDSASRFALMTAEYSQKCKVLLETPEVRIAHWVKVEQDAAAAAAKKGPMK